ncbi:hypothetical protein [Fulvimarina sp. MAC8]|uniref:hypothetical protein n=1 Tax=Fulvimarina sp. MAC8 TaxID=3162874 RepID=UPI0032EA9DB1
MTNWKSLHFAGICLAIGGVCAASQAFATEYEAASTTAMGITGDMSLTDAGMTFEDGTVLQFSESVEQPVIYNGEEMPATIYTLASPSNPVFASGNDLCGQDVTYIATWADSGGAQPGIIMTTYSGEAPPKNVDEEMCSLYWYVQK